MHRRSLALIAILVVALLAGAGGVYAYDQGKDGQIAEGIKVNGVDVGGLSASQARTKLRAALLEPLNRPVTARYEGKRYKLTPRAGRRSASTSTARCSARWPARARATCSAAPGARSAAQPIHTDLDAEGQLLAAPRSAGSSRACSATSRRARSTRTSTSSTAASSRRPSKDGRAVRAARLRRDLERELLDSGAAAALVRVRTSVVKPEVSTEELAEKYPAVLIVNRGAFKLTLYKNLKPAKTYGIAVGQVGPGDARRALPHPEQGGEPGLDDAELRLGGAQGPRQGRPRRHAREPAQGPLAGHLRRRRHPRHRRGRARSARPPRTAASGCASRT